MIQEVTDTRSNPTENIAHAAKVIQKSKHRKQVFEAIYSDQKRFKTLDEIEIKTGLPKIRITQEGGILFNNSIVTRKKVGLRFVYGKDKFINQNRKKILSLAGNQNKLSKLPTKSNPQTTIQVKLNLPKQKLQDVFITIDDIDSFSKIKKIKTSKTPKPLDELKFKKGIQNIIKEKGKFQDWGGEKNDLMTTNLVIGGKRKISAFAFKGKGTTGILTPAKMGKNGDQIQRLFESAGDVFLIQYWGKIGEKILEQMQGWAQLKSVKDGKKIFFGIIDGNDTMKIFSAYKNQFPSGTLSED